MPRAYFFNINFHKMTLLLAVLSFLFVDHSVDITNDAVLGNWEYVVEAPDMTYKGIMNIAKEEGELKGALKADGAEYPMKDIKLEGNVLTFKLNVEGFPCDVKGTFEDDTFKGEVSVEGMLLSLNAKRAVE